jgi:alpha-beta hydrolase superfamily lysophospholipase
MGLITDLSSTRQPDNRWLSRWCVALIVATAASFAQSQLHQRTQSSSSCYPTTLATSTARQLYESQEILKAYDWEWILVRIDAVESLPLEALGTDLPDPEFSLRVNAQLPHDIVFSGDLNTFTWQTLWNSPTDMTNIKGLGMAAYLRGTAESIEFYTTEKNQVDQDYKLLNQTLRNLPDVDLDDWTQYTVHQDGISVELAIKRVTRPLYTEQDQDDMGLTEYLLNLENGELASLAYKVKPNNNKAVVYFAGRSDSFAHPHVLQMYESKGYDFYSIDVRRSGRARRFLKNTYLGNDITDFKDLAEDVELALQYVHAQKNYTETVAHCHSNGALVVLSYLLNQRSPILLPDFDGYVLNSPFLAWGHVGGSLNEWVLKNAAMINSVYPQQLWGHDGLNDWWTKIWLLYRWKLAWNPVITNSLTSYYAEAASQVHRKIVEVEGYLLGDKPTLVLSSQSDDILQHFETMRLAAELHPNPTLIEFDLHSHDVTKSLTHDLNEKAVDAISGWLDDLETYRTVD